MSCDTFVLCKGRGAAGKSPLVVQARGLETSLILLGANLVSTRLFPATGLIAVNFSGSDALGKLVYSEARLGGRVFNDTDLLQYITVPGDAGELITLALHLEGRHDDLDEILRLAAKCDFSLEIVNAAPSSLVDRIPASLQSVPSDARNVLEFLKSLETSPVARKLVTVAVPSKWLGDRSIHVFVARFVDRPGALVRALEELQHALPGATSLLSAHKTSSGQFELALQLHCARDSDATRVIAELNANSKIFSAAFLLDKTSNS